MLATPAPPGTARRVVRRRRLGAGPTNPAQAGCRDWLPSLVDKLPWGLSTTKPHPPRTTPIHPAPHPPPHHHHSDHRTHLHCRNYTSPVNAHTRAVSNECATLAAQYSSDSTFPCTLVRAWTHSAQRMRAWDTMVRPGLPSDIIQYITIALPLSQIAVGNAKRNSRKDSHGRCEFLHV